MLYSLDSCFTRLTHALLALLPQVWAITPSYLVAAFCGKRLSSALEVVLSLLALLAQEYKY
jgi:hypothetical protein